MRARLPELLAVAVALAVVLLNLDAPLVDDSLFWWVPKALSVAESGPAVVLDTLPQAAAVGPTPPQWAQGLPDYAHPPLWFWYLGLWLKLPLAPHVAVHLAALPLAIALVTGTAALLRRAGGPRAAFAAAAIPLLPPIAAQLLRADTDLPLLALTPWALVALMDRRSLGFAVLAALATWCKEPGVLLAAPAAGVMLLDRRLDWAWLAPLAALAAWAGLHLALTGAGLAGAERLPESLGAWVRDLGQVLWLSCGAQGRILLWPGVAFALWRGARRRPWALLALHLGVQVLFFGTLNFLGGVERLDAHTHVRYLLPAMLSAFALGAAALPESSLAVGLLSLLQLWRPHPSGPEASLYQLDVARALRELPLPEERPLWVGSYAATQLTRPYAGLVSSPVGEVSIYGPETVPAEVVGHLVESATGEPLGRLQELELELVEEQRVRSGWARLYRVKGMRSDVAPGR